MAVTVPGQCVESARAGRKEARELAAGEAMELAARAIELALGRSPESPAGLICLTDHPPPSCPKAALRGCPKAALRLACQAATWQSQARPVRGKCCKTVISDA